MITLLVLLAVVVLAAVLMAISLAFAPMLLDVAVAGLLIWLIVKVVRNKKSK